jgi:SecD/SecF fusion protein
MKPFFWKILICLIPNLVAGWFVWKATEDYIAGEGGFKLGVDLVGGTILVYEVDATKTKDMEKGRYGTGSTDSTKLLASYLKKRIDPNDLYNIVIRMVGENRVEIILPTGGKHRAELAQKAWKQVLKEVAEDPRWAKELKNDKDVFEVGQGRVDELTERIKTRLEEKKWPALLAAEETWKKLVNQALTWYGDPAPKEKEYKKIKPGDYKKLRDDVKQHRIGVENILKIAREEAWQATLDRLEKKYLDKKANPDDKWDPARFSPTRREQLINYLLSNGSKFDQAVQLAVRPLFPPDKKAREIAQTINDLYGPTTEDIRATINKYYKTGDKRDVTSEEVERIKELIRRVGKLEFLILANNVDDKEKVEGPNGIDEAEQYLKELGKEKLDGFAKRGEAPPTPTKFYNIKTAKGQTSRVSYRWVELGPPFRKQLGLSNDQTRSGAWRLVAETRGEGAARLVAAIPDSRGGESNGYLYIYSRECKNTNLPEEKRAEKKYEYFVLARNPEIDEDGEFVRRGQPKEISGNYLTSARRSQDKYMKPSVAFEFDATGAGMFRDVTRKNVPDEAHGRRFYRHLAIVLDGLIMSAPTINSVIESRGEISGGFTVEEVNKLVNILRSGALPATLKPQPVSESTMGATLGEDTIKAGVQAVAIAFAAILLFMIVYYRFSGLVACVALLSNLLLTVGFMVAVQATFTLPGLAGLVLMLGMAVDANVLIYERLREERERGASLALAIRNGYDRAFPTIIDTHLTSIFTAIVLYVVGNDQLKGFGVSLTVGLIISLFTSLYMTRLLFDLWLNRGWLHKLSMFKLLSRPNIDFMAIRYYWFTATILLTIFGMLAFIGRGKEGLDIDFVGGTAYGGKLASPKTLKDLRALFTGERQADLLKVASVKELDQGHKYKITYQEALGKESDRVRTVEFANRPDFPTAKEREEDVRRRAQELPDWSVEQEFLSSDTRKKSDDESSYFTVRTSEKEAKLVQATIDRLLREKQKDGRWVELLARVTLSYKIAEQPREKGARGVTEATLTFSDFASPSFVTNLLNEALAKNIKYRDPNQKGVPFNLGGEGESKESHFRTMHLALVNEVPLAELRATLEETQKEFNDRPPPERLDNFDSALAAKTQGQAILAIVLSWGAILLYLWLRFGSWTFGLAAVLCLIHDLFFTLGMIAFASWLHATPVGEFLRFQDFKLDLTAVAALLTLVGYSVSDTIVVFDRIREVRGKNPDLTPQMINDSVNQTLSRTLLTAFSVWLVVSVLYVFGGPGVHLFAFVMVVGVIVGTYSSIYIASPLLLIFGEGSRSAARVRQRQPQPVESPA